MDALTIAKLLKDTGFRGYYSVGLRGLYDHEQIGELAPSWHWEDGNQTDERNTGTSVIGLADYVDFDSSVEEIAEELDKLDTALELVRIYRKPRVGLVVGTTDNSAAASDLGECVLVDAELVAILEESTE